MNKAYRPLGALAIAGISDRSATLASRRGLVELSVVAPDLFRVRMTSAKTFSGRPSWAVCKQDWPQVPARVRVHHGRVVVRTSSGTLSLRLADSAWQLQDVAGNPLFSSVALESGFAEDGCQLTLALREGESMFGLGESTGPFNKRGLIREFWNLDVLGHAPAIHPSLRSLYVSIPFALSLRQGRAAGLFCDHPARQAWDLGQTRLDRFQLKVADREIDLYLFVGPQAGQVVARYTELTGRTPLPPRWALGYHQCRYSYETQERVEAIARRFRELKIPCDAIYLDIHHLDGHRVFSFGGTFPKPRELMRKLAKQGFRVVSIVDPGVKDDAKFGVLKRGLALSAFVKGPDGKKDFLGKVWPGRSRFPDFLNARVRQWWGREQSQLLDLGVAGFWNDMNEPAVFDQPARTLPEDCVHRDDLGPISHAQAHNLYGMQMARACYEGALAHRPLQRPFVITRSGYAGVQRYALVWTGDNSSVWEHLADAVQMCLNLGVSGVAFCGSDVGGFLDNATPELLVRWTQMAAFTPFFRNHSNLGTLDQEPWALGPKARDLCRRYIELRYQLLPYLYGLFLEAHQTGAPVMRPMFWHYQHDPTAVATGDQFLLGRDLLVAPILRPGAVARSVYLPRGTWFDYWTGQRHEGGGHIVAQAPLELIPLFVRAGAILPLAAVRQHVGETEPGVVSLQVWPGDAGELRWYEDDGQSMAHLAGHWHQRPITFAPGRGGGVLRIQAARGLYESRVKAWRVILHGATRAAKVRVNGHPAAARFNPRSGFLTLEVPNAAGAIEVRFPGPKA
jgi:alpha-glucosidase